MAKNSGGERERERKEAAGGRKPKVTKLRIRHVAPMLTFVLPKFFLKRVL